MATNNIAPEGSNASAMATEEERRSLIEKIKEFFAKLYQKMSGGLKKLDDFFKGRKKGGGIVERMKQLEQAVIESVATSEMSAEAVTELGAVLNKLNGKLDALTPDKIDQMASTVEELAAEVAKRTVVYSKNNRGHLVEEVKALLQQNGVEVGESFEKEFMTCTKIFKEDGADKDTLLFECKGLVFKANAEINEESGKNNYNIKISLDGRKREDVFNEDFAFKAGFSKADEKNSLLGFSSGNAEISLVSAFCANHDMRLVLSEKQLEQQILKGATEEERWLYHHSKPTVNGNIESWYCRADNTFRVLNKENDVMLCCKAEKGRLEIVGYNNVGNIQDAPEGKSTLVATYANNQNGFISASVHTRTTSMAMLDLFRESSEIEEWAKYNNLKTESFRESLYSKKPQAASYVSQTNLPKVYKLAEICDRMLKNANEERYSVSIKGVGGKDKANATYLDIVEVGKSDKRMTLSFDPDGEPLMLSYHGEKGQEEPVFNFHTKQATGALLSAIKASKTGADRDIAFENMFDTVAQSLSHTLNYSMYKFNTTYQTGIDLMPVRNKQTEETEEIHFASAPSVPEEMRNIANGKQYTEQDKEADIKEARQVNKAAMVALNMAQNECTEDTIKSAMQLQLGYSEEAVNNLYNKLLDIGVIGGVSSITVKMNVEEYEKRICELASDYTQREKLGNSKANDNYGAFLVDCYKETWEERLKVPAYSFDKPTADVCQKLFMTIEESIGTATASAVPINEDELRRSTYRRETDKAISALEKLGFLARGADKQLYACTDKLSFVRENLKEIGERRKELSQMEVAKRGGAEQDDPVKSNRKESVERD